MLVLEYQLTQEIIIFLIENITVTNSLTGASIGTYYSIFRNSNLSNNIGTGLVMSMRYSDAYNITSNNNEDGMYLYYAFRTKIRNISINNNKDDGIYGSNNNYVNLSYLNITGNNRGIYLNSYNDNSFIVNSTIVNNKLNIYLGSSSDYNTLYGNIIGSKNSIYGPTNLNYTIPGIGNIGNAWAELGKCTSTFTRGPYELCADYNNFTIHETYAIDYAPLSLHFQNNISNCQGIAFSGNYILQNNITAIGNCFDFYTGNVKIDCNGHSIMGDGTGNGFNIFSYDNIIIQNCNINNFQYGIYLQKSNNNKFINNNLSISKYGYYISASTDYYKSDNNYFANSNITGGGILINEFSKNNTIKNILIQSTPYSVKGIWLYKTISNKIENVTINSNSGYGVDLYQSNSNIIQDITINSNSGYGIYLGSDFNNFSNINIINPSQYSLYMYGADNNTFEKLNISKKSNGLFFNGANKYNIFKNSIINHMTISSSYSIKNKFYNNYFGGQSYNYNLNYGENQFNSSISGYNIGNYWEILSCSGNETRGTYLVCTEPSSYSEDAITDYAPLASWTQNHINSVDSKLDSSKSNIFPFTGIIGIVLATALTFIFLN